MWLSFHNDIQNLFAVLHKNLYPMHVLDMLLHHYITKAVEGNDTRPSRGVEQQELPRHYVKIPTSGIFWVLHSGGCENSSTDSVNQLTSSFFIPLLKLRTYSMEKILSLTGFICASSTNFPVQAVMLVLLAKQADTFSRACTTTCHRTDHLTFISTYGLQSLVVPPVT